VRRDDRSDVGHLLDARRVRTHQPLERAEMACERERGGLAHFANPEPEEQTWQRRVLAALDGGDEIRG
jgi:hypothetical protein